jgi:type VII secretion integral membrane protein EccD
MTTPTGLGLARLTVSTPRRRLDLALPETAPVAELLPHLLRHAGEGVADEGEQHGGWALRRTTGALLEPSRNLAAQGVRDGEILHLVPRRAEWPELAYDDVVEIIAGGSRRTGRSWGKVATRRFALAVSTVVLGLGILGVLFSGPPWLAPGALALGFAVLAAITGVVLSRAMSDAVAGAAVAAVAMLYAGLGGFLIAAPAGTKLGHMGAPQVMLGSAGLLLFGIVGYVGVAALARLFVLGTAVGLLGVIAALLCFASMSPVGAAAVALTVAIALLPGYPLISVWLGRLPVPTLPERPEEMLAQRSVPERSEVYAAVSRAHELLTGLLLAAATVGAIGFVMLTRGGTFAELALAAAGGVALLLRARLFATPWQRVPLVLSGLVGLALLGSAIIRSVPAGVRPLVLVIGTALIGALVLAAGLAYSTRPPSPYLRRLADIADVLAIMVLVPLAAAVVGLFHALQGLFASAT